MFSSSQKSKSTSSGSQTPNNPAYVDDAFKEITRMIMGLGGNDSKQYVAGPTENQKLAWGGANQIAKRYGWANDAKDYYQGPQAGRESFQPSNRGIAQPIGNGGGDFGGNSGGGFSLAETLTGDATQTPDWAAYGKRYKDLQNAYQSNYGNGDFQSKFPTYESYLQWHWDTFGKNEGRDLPTKEGGLYGQQAASAPSAPQPSGSGLLAQMQNMGAAPQQPQGLLEQLKMMGGY